MFRSAETLYCFTLIKIGHDSNVFIDKLAVSRSVGPCALIFAMLGQIMLVKNIQHKFCTVRKNHEPKQLQFKS